MVATASKFQNDSRLADTQWQAYIRARDNGHTNFLAMQKQCDAYYSGDQWDAEVLAQLNREKRPALTINMILSTVNAILGEHKNRRMDIKFKPRTDASAKEAQIITQVAGYIADRNNLDWVERTVFSDGVIGGRGFFDIRIDYSENLHGDIVIVALDPASVLIDPDAKEYDPATWNEVIKTRWWSIDDVEAMFGKEKADMIRGYGNLDHHDIDEVEFIGSGRFGTDTGTSQVFSASEDEEKAIRRVRIIERQHKKLSMVTFFVDNETGDMRQVPEGWTDEKLRALADKAALGIIKRKVKRVRTTISAGRVILHDEWSQYEDFTVIPYFPYFRRGTPMGVVQNLLSPQDQLNKASSQVLHIVNSTANGGWKVPVGSLANMTADQLAEEGAKTGLVLEYNAQVGEPEKIKPNSIPTGLDRVSDKAEGSILSISGVSETLKGEDSPEVSGVAMDKKKKRGLVGMEPIFTSMEQSRHLLAGRLLRLVQKFYTNERVIRVIDYKSPDRESEELIINEGMEDGSLINSMAMGEYDVVVSSMPSQDTANDAQFAEIVSLRMNGIAIPDHEIILRSNLDNKVELAEQSRRMAGMGELTPEEQEMQSQQQQMAMERAVLELEELQAKTEKLTSAALLDEARAEQLRSEGEVDGAAYGAKAQSELKAAQDSMIQKMAELKTRIAITKDNNAYRYAELQSRGTASLGSKK